MNNKDLDVLIEEGEKILKENGLDKDSIEDISNMLKANFEDALDRLLSTYDTSE